jgi:hypothetical protein
MPSAVPNGQHARPGLPFQQSPTRHNSDYGARQQQAPQSPHHAVHEAWNTRCKERESEPENRHQEQAWNQAKRGNSQPEYPQQADVAGNPAFGRHQGHGAYTFAATWTEALELLHRGSTTIAIHSCASWIAIRGCGPVCSKT